MRPKNPYKDEPEFAAWTNMRRKKWPMALAWHDYTQFKRDVGLKPSPYAVLKRIDTKEGYFPDNVFWYDKYMAKLEPLDPNLRIQARIARLRAWGRSIGMITDVPEEPKTPDDPFGQDLDLPESPD